MKFVFDALGQYKKPVLTLCNPQRDQLYVMKLARNIALTPVFNDLWEMSFRIPHHINDWVVPYYDKVEKYRLVKVENFEWFVISSITEFNDGKEHYKEVKCHSYETVLNRHKINIPDGTYEFWNPSNPNNTFLGKLISTIPSWKIGYVSESLWSQKRTVEIPDSYIYNYMMNDMQKTYGCIVDFYTNNMLINVYAPDDVLARTGIFLSLDNLIKELSVETNNDAIITALTVIGDDTIGINLVNPMGTNVIYNFRYFMTIEWMSHSLIDALNKWETKFALNQQTYADLLTLLKDENSALTILRSNLVDLQGQYTALYALWEEYVAQGKIDLSDITGQLNKNKQEQAQVVANIKGKESSVSKLQSQLSAINKSLQFENNDNFTAIQLEELNSFIFTDTYQNSNFSVTDNMTSVEEQELAQELYNQGVSELKQKSQPMYTITVTPENFLFLDEYELLIRQVKLGATINVRIRPDLWLEPVLLKMEIDYEDPTNFSMVFSNRYRLNDSTWAFDELMNDNHKSSNKVAVSAFNWTQGVQKVNEVSELINTFSFVSTSSQDISTDSIKTIGDKIVYISDNGGTIETLFGSISNPDGSGTSNGFSADAMIGNIIIGLKLKLFNEDSTFVVDKSGVKILSGSLGGWTITANGIADTKGNYLKSDGTGKIGLYTYNNETAEYEGGFYFSKALDKIQINNLSDTFGKNGNIVVGSNTLTFSNGILTDIQTS